MLRLALQEHLNATLRHDPYDYDEVVAVLWPLGLSDVVALLPRGERHGYDVLAWGTAEHLTPLQRIMTYHRLARIRQRVHNYCGREAQRSFDRMARRAGFQPRKDVYESCQKVSFYPFAVWVPAYYADKHELPRTDLARNPEVRRRIAFTIRAGEFGRKGTKMRKACKS